MSKYVSYDEMVEILDNKYLLPFRKDERLRGLSGIDIVRCDDCKYWAYEAEGDFGIKYGFCEHPDFPASVLETTHGDFCSYGERSE